MDDFAQDHKTKPRHVSRRELAEALLSGVAAGLVAPLLPSLHPVRRLLLEGAALDAAEARLSPDLAQGAFLSGPQLAALAVLAEAVVPGSRRALAPQFIDLLLSMDTREHREEFLRSLAALERAAQHRARKSLAFLSPAELQELLTGAASQGSPLEADFLNLRHWIAGAYYSSEAGMRELGWTPDRVFPSYPACAHSEGHS